jgi:hypothetical protein
MASKCDKPVRYLAAQHHLNDTGNGKSVNRKTTSVKNIPLF